MKRWSAAVRAGQRRRAPAELDDLRRIAGVGGRLSGLDEHLDALRGSDGGDLGRSGGEDRRGLGGNAAAQLDRAAQVHLVGADAEVGHRSAGAVEQRERLLGMAGEPRILSGRDEPAAAGLVAHGQLCRALERPPGGREPAPAPRAPCGLLELARHLFVVADRARGPVPGAAIRVLLAVQDLRQRAVDRLALGERGIRVERRADQRMTELDGTVERAHEAGLLRRIECGRLELQRRGRAEHRGEPAGVVRRHDQQQALRRRRQAAHAIEVDALDLGALRERIREGRATGELVLAQEPRQLDQRERIPARALDQPVPHRRRER